MPVQIYIKLISLQSLSALVREWETEVIRPQKLQYSTILQYRLQGLRHTTIKKDFVILFTIRDSTIQREDCVTCFITSNSTF